MWEAAGKGRLMLPFCPSCARFFWPPNQANCRNCGAPTEWRESAGNGRIASYSVVHRATNPAFAGEVPYVVAFVELEDGVRLMSNIVDCDPARLRVGQSVTVTFEDTDVPELGVPVFRPAGEGER